jgi:tetraacyldisaccharide 4'-kinase
MKQRAIVKIEQWLREEKKSFFSWLLRSSLILPSYIFKAFIKARHLFFNWGILKTHRCSIPVVSIGNVVLGGVGKTPVILKLAEELLKTHRVAVLSRGYKAQAEKDSSPCIVSEGKGPIEVPQICGDESYLIARRLPQAIVISGKNRRDSSELAAQMGAQIILLDDGMQHRQLYRNVEIVVMDGSFPRSAHYFFPRGFLRDDPKRLKQADCILLNGGSHSSSNLKNISCEKVVRVENKVTGIFLLDGSPIESIKGIPLGIFCGIANPQRFVETIRELNGNIIASYFLGDHEEVNFHKLIKWSSLLSKQGAKLMLCTEKDAVKLLKDEEWKINVSLPIAWIKCDLLIKQNALLWESLIENIKHLTGPRL